MGHEDFMTIISEEKNLSRIKRKHQNDENSLKRNEIFNNILKSQI